MKNKNINEQATIALFVCVFNRIKRDSKPRYHEQIHIDKTMYIQTIYKSHMQCMLNSFVWIDRQTDKTEISQMFLSLLFIHINGEIARKEDK